MTLFRQIGFLLSIFLIILFFIILILNLQSAQKIAEDKIYLDTKNHSSIISYIISNNDFDLATSILDNDFNHNNYTYIIIHDMSKKIIYKRENKTKDLDIPTWFIDIFKIKIPIVISNISTKDNQVATLEIKSDVNYIYQNLFSLYKNLLLYFSILIFLTLTTLYILLTIVLKPLKSLKRQISGIVKNDFIAQEKLPKTTELRNLIIDINHLISEQKNNFEKINTELKTYKQQDYIDRTTKLYNRKYFIEKLPRFLKKDAKYTNGIHILIAIIGIKSANEQIGHKEVDSLFLDIANILKSLTNDFSKKIISRMNGTEFSIFIPNCNTENAISLAKEIHTAIENSILSYTLDDTKIYNAIGLYEYNHMQTSAEILSFSDNALIKAKHSNSLIYIDTAEKSLKIMGKDAWRFILNDAIDYARFSFISWHVYNAKSSKVDHNVLSISMEDSNGNFYSFGQFMPSAIELDLSVKAYQTAIELLFRTPDIKLKNSKYSLRLSYEYLVFSKTYDNLSELLNQFVNNLSFKLIIEIPDKLAREQKELVKNYKNLFEIYNIEMGLFEFIGESEDFNYLQELRPIFIKAKSDYYLNLNNSLLNELRLIADNLDTLLIATSVMDKSIYLELEKKDIFIIQGKITEVLKLM